MPTIPVADSGLDRRSLLALVLATIGTAAAAPPVRAAVGTRTYNLEPQEIADGVFLLRGRDEHLSVKNGGNIANIVFMTTGDGIILFDTGPSRIYGEELREAIRGVTLEPIAEVFISHAHPDHYLGSQVFEDLPISCLPATQKVMSEIGELFTDNMYRLVDVWMRGTRTVIPNRVIAPGRQKIGRRDIEFLALGGHSQADLAIYDHGDQVLLAGDLVFMDRAPTTPQADLAVWHQSLDHLQALPLKTVVSGHGPVTEDARAIEQTRSYLTWLEDTLRRAAEEGLSEAEAIDLPVDSSFDHLAVVQDEFIRSITHLYGQIATDSLEPIAGG